MFTLCCPSGLAEDEVQAVLQCAVHHTRHIVASGSPLSSVVWPTLTCMAAGKGSAPVLFRYMWGSIRALFRYMKGSILVVDPCIELLQ